MSKKTQIHKTDNDRDQAAAFRKAARDLGCADSEEQFQDALRKIARHKPDSDKPKKLRNPTAD